MKIKTVEISGFRQVKEAKLNMEKDITIIAGANNSGKTSLVELFNYVFGSNGSRFSGDDFSADACFEWSKRMYPLVIDMFKSDFDKEVIIENISNLVFPSDVSQNAIMIPKIEVKIEVDYQIDNDDIRNFADCIMDLEPTCHSFYYVYEYTIIYKELIKNLDRDFDKFKNRINKLTGDDIKDRNIIPVIKEMLTVIYANSSKERVYFTDRNYDNKIEMEINKFKGLFNYHNIKAGRYLDDEHSDRAQILSETMIDIASQDADWSALIEELPDKIIEPIQDAEIQRKVRETSLDSLSGTMKKISTSNGGNTGNIILDTNITEKAIHSLLKNITSAKFQIDDCYLKESSQGLGYSNLIFIHLQLEGYKKSIDPYLVNFFVIEEPEAHMHPQMQHAFINYLINYYTEQDNIHGLITTHSSEVVREAKMERLRVLRRINAFKGKLFDLRDFCNQKNLKKDFYDIMYTINFSDIIFADKIIMYEGDTERMLIKSLVNLSEYTTLREQYLSYVQVGGAYAFNYNPLIEFLELKTLIVTDIDYAKLANNAPDILASKSTNYTINSYYNLVNKNEEVDLSPKIEDIYKWKDNEKPIINEMIYLAFQSEKDGFSRTLEEAMLSKKLNIDIFLKKTRKEWEEIRESSGLKFSIPREKESSDIRDIVLSTSNGKTNFMYSVILNTLIEDMLPEYIKEGLLWLKN
ncbi:AAA family ATPase [Listeria innocua]|nr:AAA family ATPase [Listeria monocytogenes]ELD8333493.1 AAA family ATPase [Listeria innocua]ELY0464585.1 AAA family ATPase [Listeria innocua]ELY0467465.1 AAA family ATPase [Listeria innocua]ELY0470417.1 AAA family ATPase [Listeria innocua]